MKFFPFKPVRVFKVGNQGSISITDSGHIHLEADEQVTFKTTEGKEYDVTRKNFGFYATPSLNGRLKKFGLRPALVGNSANNFYILLVEEGKETLFKKYLSDEALRLVLWMDDTDKLLKMERIIETNGLTNG